MHRGLMVSNRLVGKTGIVRGRAPLRLGFAGGGTDVSPFCDTYGGAVLNATISMYAYATLEVRDDEKILFQSNDRGCLATYSLHEPLPKSTQFDLHRGVYERVVRDFLGGERFACSLRTHCDAPPGSGLGSSSTLVVAILSAFQELLDLPLGEYELAHLAYEIERNDLRLSGGRQDQYAAAFGGVNFMEFGGDDRVIVNPLRIKGRFMAELEASLVLFFTGVSRDSATIIDEQVANMSTNSGTTIEAAQRMKIDATLIKEAMLIGDIHRFGRVLNASWTSKKMLAKQVSNDQIDSICQIALQSGAYAAKISGAGGGGFIMFLCDPPSRPHLIQKLTESGGQVFPVCFVGTGAEAWSVEKFGG